MAQIDAFLIEYGKALEEAARLGAEETRLEDERKAVFSRLVVGAGDLSATKAEHVARGSTEYAQASDSLATVRLQCALAKAKAQHMTARLEVWRTRESSRRASQQRRDHYAHEETQD